MPMSLGSPGRGTPAQKGRPSETPWARMLRHRAVWAIIVNNFTFHYAFYVVMNWLPTYFDQVIPRRLCMTRWTFALSFCRNVRSG